MQKIGLQKRGQRGAMAGTVKAILKKSQTIEGTIWQGYKFCPKVVFHLCYIYALYLILGDTDSKTHKAQYKYSSI